MDAVVIVWTDDAQYLRRQCIGVFLDQLQKMSDS